jgi:hypothetical protein
MRYAEGGIRPSSSMDVLGRSSCGFSSGFLFFTVRECSLLAVGVPVNVPVNRQQRGKGVSCVRTGRGEGGLQSGRVLLWAQGFPTRARGREPGRASRGRERGSEALSRNLRPRKELGWGSAPNTTLEACGRLCRTTRSSRGRRLASVILMETLMVQFIPAIASLETSEL